MTARQDERGAPRAGRRAGVVARLWARAVDGLAALGTILIGLLMLVIAADVVARNTMGASLPLVSELGALMLVMIVYLQLAATVRADRLARTEIFFVPFCRSRPRVGALLSAAFDLVGAAAVGAIGWSTIRILEKDYASHEYIGVTGIATVQTWPFRVLILVGVFVAAVQFAIRVWSALRVAAGREAKA
ncbi:MAG TPA: TRAP transporter small permease subunit [Afifellaceae bacterium]|nr:TRAP transporter small permease subunit [Afifellaceae bacterium]